MDTTMARGTKTAVRLTERAGRRDAAATASGIAAIAREVKDDGVGHR